MSNWKEAIDEGLSQFDEFDMTIEKAYFAPVANFADGNMPMLHLIGTNPNLPPEYRIRTLTFPVGVRKENGVYEAADNGATLIRRDGGKVKFHKFSQMGRLVARVIAEFDLSDMLSARGDANEAKVWEGLRFHFKKEADEVFGKDEDGKDQISKGRVMPIAFLGEGDASDSTIEVGSGLRDHLLELARKASNHDSFVMLATTTPGVTDDVDLLNAVTDPTGIFAEARA